MGRTWNNEQFLVGTVELRQGFSVHTNHRLVVPSDDQKRGGPNSVESIFRKIRPASAGNDCKNDIGKLGSRHERGTGPGTGSKITHFKVLRVGTVHNPIGRANQTLRKERDVKTKFA